MEQDKVGTLRSPYERLGPFVLLPRIIDKVRLYAQGQLPSAYHGNLLKPGLTLDGQFLAFTGLDGSELQQVILKEESDESVMAWVESHVVTHSDAEIREWAQQLQIFRVRPQFAKRLRGLYSNLPLHVDFTAYSLFDLIDMDEGRLPIPIASSEE